MPWSQTRKIQKNSVWSLFPLYFNDTKLQHFKIFVTSVKYSRSHHAYVDACVKCDMWLNCKVHEQVT